jgi:hypothetical protein
MIYPIGVCIVTLIVGSLGITETRTNQNDS